MNTAHDNQYLNRTIRVMSFAELFDSIKDIAAGLTRDDCMKIINECRKPADPADRVDFSDEIAALDALIDPLAYLDTSKVD